MDPSRAVNKYKIQLPGLMPVYGTPALLYCGGWGRGGGAETTEGITRNVSKSGGTVNSHLSSWEGPRAPLFWLQLQAAFVLVLPNWSDLCIEFLSSSKFGKLTTGNIHENALSSRSPILEGRAESGPAQPVALVTLTSFEGQRRRGNLTEPQFSSPKNGDKSREPRASVPVCSDGGSFSHRAIKENLTCCRCLFK